MVEAKAHKQRQAHRRRSALHPDRVGRRPVLPDPPGTDIAFLSGLAKYLLDNDKIQHRYVAAYTNAGYVV